MSEETKLYSVGEIATLLGQKRERVLYVIDSRGIKPVHRAARWRLFDEAAVTCIRAAMAQIDAKRGC